MVLSEVKLVIIVPSSVKEPAKVWQHGPILYKPTAELCESYSTLVMSCLVPKYQIVLEVVKRAWPRAVEGK